MKSRSLRQIIRAIVSDLFPPDLFEEREYKRLGRKPPDLMWELCARGPEGRTETGTKKVGHQFFIFGGYQTLERVLSVVDVFDLNTRRWTERIPMPARMPQTHLGISGGEERFIYTAGGQLGAQCSPAVADCFVLDVRTRNWSTLPPLPEPRYAATMQLRRGRLHAIAGSKPDRCTPACDHWSIAVAGGKALEKQWREEVPIPRGGPHRASTLCEDKLYVFGGQEGDATPLPGDPNYTFNPDSAAQTVYGDSFVWDGGSAPWKSISPMPTPLTHAESAFMVGPYAVLVGGEETRRRVSDLVQLYDTRADRWKIGGRLPFAMKTVATYHDGWLYTIAGLRSRDRRDLTPIHLMNSVWRAKFDPASAGG